MPTDSGAETIREAIDRLNADLSRVRAAIARVETNGVSFSMGGKQVSQAAYASLVKREKEIRKELNALHARVDGGKSGRIISSITRYEP